MSDAMNASGIDRLAGRKAGFRRDAKLKDFMDFEANDLGQSCPQHCPQQGTSSEAITDGLGQPISIREVAHLVGCSTWTIRHRYLPRGLPRLRLGRKGKLIFYKSQVIRWLLLQLEKGGTIE